VAAREKRADEAAETATRSQRIPGQIVDRGQMVGIGSMTQT
jgi:hypothetical protein